MSVLHICEVIGGKAYLQFHLSMPDGTYFAFKMFDIGTNRKLLQKVLWNEPVVLWFKRKPFKPKPNKKTWQFYYSQHKFYYYKDSHLCEAAVNEDHLDVIADFLIASYQRSGSVNKVLPVRILEL